MPSRSNTDSEISEANLAFIQKLGNSIKAIRSKKGLTQSKLAAEVGLTPRHFQKIEAGSIDVKASTVRMVAESLNINPCYLTRVNNQKNIECCGILCEVELLDILPIGVQVHNIAGEILYLNRNRRKYLDLLNWKRNEKPLYIWDYKPVEGESGNSKSYLLRLVNEPAKINHKDKTNGSDKVKWDYILDSEQNIKGFITIFL